MTGLLTFFINNANDKLLPIVEEVEKFINDQKIYIFSEVLDKRSKLRNYFEKSRNCAAIACYLDKEIGIKKISPVIITTSNRVICEILYFFFFKIAE